MDLLDEVLRGPRDARRQTEATMAGVQAELRLSVKTGVATSIWVVVDHAMIQGGVSSLRQGTLEAVPR